MENLKKRVKILKERYEDIAKSLDYNTTACDYNLRELEIDTASKYMKNGDKILDVGCGLGYAVVQYAIRRKVNAYGIDYSKNMISGAKKLIIKHENQLRGTVTFKHASVINLPYNDNSFDVVSSSRCLMALLDWKIQQKALIEIHRVLKKGGKLVLMEGTFDGLKRLNDARNEFNLAPIEAGGKDRLFTLKFHEKVLLDFCSTYYKCKKIKRFGMYYFLTRIVQPLLVAPNSPRYDHKINEIAKQIARKYPDFKGLGHLVTFILEKK